MKRETVIDSVMMRVPEGLSHESQQSHRDQRDAFPNTHSSHLIPSVHKSPAPQENNYFLCSCSRPPARHRPIPAFRSRQARALPTP